MGQNGNGLKTATARKLNGNGTGTERNYPSRCTDREMGIFFMPTVYTCIYTYVRTTKDNDKLLWVLQRNNIQYIEYNNNVTVY